MYSLHVSEDQQASLSFSLRLWDVFRKMVFLITLSDTSRWSEYELAVVSGHCSAEKGSLRQLGRISDSNRALMRLNRKYTSWRPSISWQQHNTRSLVWVTRERRGWKIQALSGWVVRLILGVCCGGTAAHLWWLDQTRSGCKQALVSMSQGFIDCFEAGGRFLLGCEIIKYNIGQLID